MENGAILLIDDDEDDQYLFLRALQNLGLTNPVHTFIEVEVALEFLRTSQQRPFLIFCEINLPATSGLELRQQIEADGELRRKAVPFVYLTDLVEDRLIEQAYEYTIQGLFEKRHDLARWQSQLQAIIAYWTECVLPYRFTAS